MQQTGWLAIVAALFLTLLVTFLLLARPTSRGIVVTLAPSTCDCGDESERMSVLHIAPQGQLLINDEPVARDRLRNDLAEIYRYRAERVLYVDPAPERDFQDVAGVLALAQSSADGLKLKLVTPASANVECPQYCWNWKKNGHLLMPATSEPH
jgi:biopolymer transport protein ExbD